MAFGGDDVEIIVTLVKQAAERAAEEFTQGLIDGAREAAKEFGKTEDAVGDIGPAAKKAGREAASGFSDLQKAIITINQGLQLITQVAGKVTGAFQRLRDLAELGDRLGDLREAFEANAEAAKANSDVILNDLNFAFKGALTDIELFAVANRAFAAGLDPAQFDDVAAAARRYAESIDGDAKQATEELITAIARGNEGALRRMGFVVRDGVVEIEKFSNAQKAAILSTRSVTDVFDQYGKSIRDSFGRIGEAINKSEALKRGFEALAQKALGLVTSLEKLAIFLINLADGVIARVTHELNLFSNGLAVVGELARQIGRGELPSLAKANAAVVQQLAAAAKQGEKTEKVFAKLGKSTDEAGKAATDYKRQIADALQDADIRLNDLFNLESYVIPGTADSLRDRIKTALRQVNPLDIIADLKKVRAAFLDGITGKPEEIAAEVQKRLAILDKETKIATDEISGPTRELPDKPSDKLKSSIFGIDTGSLAPELASALENAIGTSLSLAAQALTSGVGRESAEAIGAAVGTVVGAAIGAYFGSPEAGAAIGGVVGQFIGKIAETFGKDGAGTKARKEADRFFADMFDADRLSVIVGDQIVRIRDLVFAGQGKQGGVQGFLDASQAAGPAGVVTAVGAGIAGATGSNNAGFDSAQAFASFDQLPARAQAAFQAVGVSMEEFLGLSDDISGQIGAVLVNNIGGSLENLQILVQTTGKTFEELGDQLFNAFFDGTIGLEELLGQLQALNDLYLPGIPGQVGAVEEAIRNFQIALADGKGSRILLDSLRDIAAETQEVGGDFQSMVNTIAQSFGFSTSQVQQFLEAMKLAGINSIEQLVNASNAKLAALAGNIKAIAEGRQPTFGAISDQTAGTTAPGNFIDGLPARPPGGGGASRGGGGISDAQRKADEAKRKREQEFQQVYKLLQASAAYEKILDAIASKELTRKDANKEIAALYDQIAKATKAVTDAEDRYQKALQNGNKKQLADLANRLKEAQEKLDKVAQSAKEAEKAVKFDLSKVTPLIRDLNQLGVISRAVGVNIEGITDTLVAGFLRGKISLADFNAELKKSEEILGKGIPTVVGGTAQAFQNLIDGGLEGGAFSVDAFKDVFNEFDEQFATQSSAARQKQLGDLTTQFNAARDALDAAILGGAAPAEVDKLRDQFEGAKKALEDFKATPAKAGFEDLRATLEQTFSPEQVSKFFQALENSGVTDLEQFQNLSNEQVTKILGDLQSLGFQFGETSQDVKDINKAVDDAITQANGGKDVLQVALDTIKQFNEALVALPGQADAGTSAMAALADGFGRIVQLVGQLDGRTFENDVIFNVRTNGTAGEKALVDVLFGDGGGAADGPTSGSPGLTPRQRRRFEELRRKKKNGRLTAREQEQFDRLQDLRG